MTTYTLTICGHESESGLTPTEVVSRIYNHDRASFWLEPTMLETENENGEVISEQQEVFAGKLAWDVWFKDPRGNKCKGVYQAYGNTEDEAEQAYLLECFEDTRWNDAFFVQSDEEALAETS
jgi:hypothetical protein